MAREEGARGYARCVAANSDAAELGEADERGERTGLPEVRIEQLLLMVS